MKATAQLQADVAGRLKAGFVMANTDRLGNRTYMGGFAQSVAKLCLAMTWPDIAGLVGDIPLPLAAQLMEAFGFGPMIALDERLN